MKRPPESPRRGGASPRARTSSEPPSEPADRQPVAQRAASTRRSVIWPIGLIALFVILAVLTSTTWILAHDAAETQRRLQLARANSLLAAQQLDAVFEVLWNHFPKDQQLTPTDRALLQTWMRFDEKYVFDNSDNPQSRFQCATVHRRIGQGTFMLGNIPEALEHFHHTIDLFESLVLDQPTITSYRSELADAYVRLAWVLHAQGDAAGIEDVFQQAIQEVDDAPLLNDPAYNAKCAVIFSSLADLALLRGEHARVRPLLERSAQLYRDLLKESPEIEEYRALLTQVEAKLASTNYTQP